jgi:MurNAc alpha-1-phosphate uridylyltransferase
VPALLPTETTSQPLLQVQGQPLLQWHLATRQGAGAQVVINAA